MRSWIQRVRDVAVRNRPSRKPQLWEDPWLAMRRRLAFEVNRKRHDGWLDQPHVIDLSRVGFDDDDPAPPRMAVVPREMINQSLFLYGTFEISETRLIQSLLREGMTFLDIGANIGYYTVIGARLVGPTGKVHCFEPHSEIRTQLEENVARNGYQNVVVHAEAMAERTGTVSFFVSADEQNQGTSSIVRGSGEKVARQVPSVCLDEFVTRLNPPRLDLIKMDIEGAELQVIAGGRRTLAADDAPPIIFEAANLEPIARALSAFGYRIRRHHYTLARGLDLLDPDAVFDDIFKDYEAPNYFAAKNEGVFQAAIAGANADRPAALRLLGRI
jgi:FkbM family methyltransferase